MSNVIAARRAEARGFHYPILYPEKGTRTGERLVQYAQDHLATEYQRANPDAPQEAVDENARVNSVVQAIDILSDAGLFTFYRGARQRAEELELGLEDSVDRAEKALGVE